MELTEADDERQFPLENIVIGCHSYESFESFSKAISACVVSTPPGEQQDEEEKKIKGVRSRRIGEHNSASNRDNRMRLMFMLGTDCSVSSTDFSSDNNDVYTSSSVTKSYSYSSTIQTTSTTSSDATLASNCDDTSKRRVNRLKTIQEKNACMFELNKPVPLKFLQYIELPANVSPASASKDCCSRKTTEFTVLSMSPFAKGYMNYSTELVAILSLNSCSHPPSTHLRLPIVSDFLANYQSSGSPAESTVLDAAVLGMQEIATAIYSIDTRDETLFVNSKFAHDFGVMNGGVVRVRMDERRNQQRHYMHVSVVKEQGSCVLISPIGWFNLGGSTMAEQHLISIKKVVPSKMAANGHSPRSSSSASLNSLCDELSTAKQVTVGRVHLSSDVLFDLSLTEPLQQYFSTDRYLQVGDVFLLNVSKRGADDEKVLMKVQKVNNSNKTTSTYRVNKQTTLYEGTQVNSYIPPGVSSYTDVEIGLSFESTRIILINLLRPFVMHEWHTNSLPFILLAGPEGSGRSLLIRQICQLLQCNYVEVNCVNLVADTVNSTEARIKELFSQAKLLCPAVVSLRNIDCLTKEEPLRVENPRIAQYFHTQLVEAIESSQLPVIVFGTCNKLSSVSEGIRETALHEVTMQDADGQERLYMLEELTNGMHLHPDVCLQYFAERTAGFLYGDLKALAVHAVRNSLTRAYSLCKKHIGYVCEESINSARILVITEDFQKGLDAIQSVQSLDLGAPKIPNVKWADIGGLQKVEDDILDTIQLPLKHPNLFISAMRRSGVLLYGPPGTGKTLLAKAVATECSLNFFSVKGPELINMYVGQSEENIRQVFQKARSASPCVIFFDELDSLAPNRGKSGDSGGVMDRVVSQLLAELDGLVKSCDVFVIGATNRPDLLDPALLRPGRFDKLVYVGISGSSAEQLTILQAITRQFVFEKGCDLELVSQRCPANMTGADLYSVCAEAVTNAIKRQIDLVQTGKPVDECKLAVSLEDFLQAIEQTTPSLSASEIARYEQVRRQFSKEADTSD